MPSFAPRSFLPALLLAPATLATALALAPTVSAQDATSTAAPSAATTTASAASSEPTAASPSPEQIREARALFNLAHAHYDAGRFAEAAAELERALAIAPRAQLYFDLHLAYREMGDTERSANALRHYLAEHDGVDPEQRVTLERRLAALDRTLAERAAGQTDATVQHADAETRATDEALRAETIEVETEALETTPIDRGDEGLPLTPGVVAVTVGGLALVGAAIAGGVSLSTMASRDGMCDAGVSGMECPASVPQEALLRDFQMQRDVAWGLFGAGAAVAVAGAVLVGIAASDDRAPSVSVACTDTGCMAGASGAF
jgi:tetratricopeptide (TPR) repeat protein